MRVWITPSVCLCLGFFAATSRTQQPQQVPVPQQLLVPQVDATAPKLPLPGECSNLFGCCGPGCAYPAGCVWADAEALLWWTKGDRLPPLLTTSPPGTAEAVAGVLGQPGTTVLFGNRAVDTEERPGGRFYLGTWLNEQHTTGIEGDFLFLGGLGTNFHESSTGIPILARPFVFEDPTSPSFGQNGSLKVAYPGLVMGQFQANTSSNFYGAEIYLRQTLCCGCCYRVDLLAGYRYLHLNEGLQIAETEIDTNPASPLVNVPFVIHEGYNTSNNFNGGLLGLAGDYQCGHWFARAIGKLAVGDTSRSADINGTTQVGNLPTFTGGFLALPSNIGHYNSSEVSVVPEITLNLGYDINSHVRLYTGYNFLYWTGVERPGDQIDLRVNSSQPPLGNGLVGQPLPAFGGKSSDFWAQGISLGLEFRF
jgi:hypothetical protein